MHEKKYESEIVLVVHFRTNIPREPIRFCLRKMSSDISENATVIKVKLKRTFETIYSFLAIFLPPQYAFCFSQTVIAAEILISNH